MEKKTAIRVILLSLILIAGIFAIYFTFFYNYTCDDLACFKAHQKECARTDFLNDGEEAAWFYEIQGKRSNGCEIDVTLKALKKGTIEKKRLEGSTMTCVLPLGDISSPEGDISKCHGILKEEMQNFIIQKLHQYIVENVGEIGNELKGVGDITSSEDNEANSTGI